METVTSYKYIVKKLHSREPILRGTRIAVRDVVEDWRMGTSPEEIPSLHPHLTLAQVFEALAYYQDHKEEVDSFIEKNRIPGGLSDKALSR